METAPPTGQTALTADWQRVVIQPDTPPPPLPNDRLVPEVYTPGQPFILTRDVVNLQLMVQGASRIPGTGYLTNLTKDTNLTPELEKADSPLDPAKSYYVLAFANDASGNAVRIPNVSFSAAGGQSPSNGTLEITRNTSAGFNLLPQNAAIGRNVEIYLHGFGGVVNPPHGQWHVSGASAAQANRRDYNAYDNGSYIRIEVSDFYTEDDTLDRSTVNPRDYFTWWSGTKNTTGELDLHTQRSVIALGRWAREHLGAARVILRGDSGGGGGALFAALADPGVFDAVAAIVPWTAVNNNQDTPGEVTMLSPERFGRLGLDLTTPIVNDTRRVGDYFDAAARVGAAVNLPPLVMFAASQDPSMTWINDTALVQAMSTAGRPFAFFWNPLGHSGYKPEPEKGGEPAAGALLNTLMDAARTGNFANIASPPSYPRRALGVQTVAQELTADRGLIIQNLP